MSALEIIQFCDETTIERCFGAEALLHFKAFNFAFTLLGTDSGIIRKQQLLALAPDDSFKVKLKT